MINNKTHNIAEYVVTCVSEFSRTFGLTMQQAYAYLRRFDAISFLIECYDAEHTLSIEDAVADMRDICLRHGGRIA